jgi:hypothetical protein
MDVDERLPASPEKNDEMNAFGRAEDETNGLNSRVMHVEAMDIETDELVPEVGARSKADESRLQSAEKLSPKVSKDTHLLSRAAGIEIDSQSKACKPCKPCEKRADKIPPRKASAEASVMERVLASLSVESTTHQEDRPIERLVTPPSPKQRITTSSMNNPMLCAPIPRKKAAASSSSSLS